MFVTRLVSGIVLLLLTGAVIITGGDLLFAALMVVSLIGLVEAYRILNIHKKLIGYTGYFAVIIYYLLLRDTSDEFFSYFTIGVLILFMGVYVFSYPNYRTEEILLAFFGVFYVAVMLSHVYRVRMLDHGILIVWLIFISSWASDTCAYCVGMLTGKLHENHKLAPKLSPKKSVEGAIGGVAGSFLIGMLYGSLAGSQLSSVANPAISCALLCAAGSVISQIGDLAASAIKRNYEIKDYGTLIPGHGGILDRFDSVIFTAPVIYFLAAVIMPLYH